jgi:hypothetical protein
MGQYFEYKNQKQTEITGEVSFLVNHLNKSRFQVNSGFLKLNSKPQDSLNHQFTIQVFLKDNTSFERKTSMITFKK